MKTTRQSIHEHLGLTLEGYETQYFERYSNWCESIVLTLLEYQKVLANSKVNKWYNTEFEKCETEFLHLIKEYPKTSIESKKQCYDECVVRLFSIFPKAILDDVKKREPVNQRAMMTIGVVKIEPQFLTLN
ncbi:hypothetical protein [Flavobacterium sp.]|uniref:hypothetical protein n=1 Tax=Flavobacterium sp. TaxID=239 RepID=UPI003752895F